MVTKELLQRVEKLGFIPLTFSTRWTFDAILGRQKNMLINDQCISNLTNEIVKWLRDKFYLFATVELQMSNSEDYSTIRYESVAYFLKKEYEEFENENLSLFDTYEEALIDSIKDCLIIIETLNNVDIKDDSKSN